MGRIFVTTDTHGELDKLNDCLSQANFNNDEDQLIHIGDVVDRGPDSYGVVELLLSIKNGFICYNNAYTKKYYGNTFTNSIYDF